MDEGLVATDGDSIGALSGLSVNEAWVGRASARFSWSSRQGMRSNSSLLAAQLDPAAHRGAPAALDLAAPARNFDGAASVNLLPCGLARAELPLCRGW